ncbi:PqqD family protein [Tepidamorphus sp. 3E244]|uniref:PqqD family protein n=1 Tax=Tepidamorphus sp. 3E244 TaxID=3385498 RepID=UPI0038FCFED9
MADNNDLSSTVYSLTDQASLQGLGESEGGVLLKLETGELYTVNETAYLFLSRLDGKRTVADAAGAISEEYDVDTDSVIADLSDLISQLEDEDLLVRGG